MIVKRPLTDNVTGKLHTTVTYMKCWGLFNTLDAQNSLEVLKEAIVLYGKPEIINSDQGSQFTCSGWVEYLKNEDIIISMDGGCKAWYNTVKLL